jgi:hypothetical protein
MEMHLDVIAGDTIRWEFCVAQMRMTN